jgi:integrase
MHAAFGLAGRSYSKVRPDGEPPLRLALYLLLYTGQRGGDVIKMRWADVVGDTILICLEKTNRQNPDRIAIPIHSNLARILELTPRDSNFVLTSNWKRPYANVSTFSHAMSYVLEKIGAGDYTAHGLRKNAGEALAEAGCTENEIMAVLGHLTSKMAQHRVRKANRGHLARSAMSKREQAK